LRLIASHKSRGPIETLPITMRAKERIRAELEKVTAVLEPKLANDGFEAFQVFQAHAGSSFRTRQISCGVGFHSVKPGSWRSNTGHFREVRGRLNSVSMLRRTPSDGNLIILTL
jgi:hypothetical protein